MKTGISHRQWKKIGTRRRAGVLLGLFQVYSRQSQGIGDYSDLKTIVDWAGASGMSVIQLLPMNEVGGTFCPYDSVSSCALETAYLSLAALPVPYSKGFAKQIQALRQEYDPAREYVDYGIKDAKCALLRKMFASIPPKNERAFTDYCDRNSSWLQDFALYKALKARFNQTPWYEWPLPFRQRDEQALRDFSTQHSEDISFIKWVQWLLYEQLRGIKAYANKKSVLLKGDLPILVSRDSADVWSHPEFFKLQYAAGAPPDMYCARGQRWGMPTYNWEAIARDDYRYFKEKLRYAESFYNLLRIDHVVGLFRIWSIPFEDDTAHQGLHGSFDPPDESRWEEHGRSLLSLIVQSTSMLICAEDLGTIPAACRRTLAESGIPGNDVQRWTKDWHKRHDFLPADEYRLLSVAMLSTHDTTNWAAWWQYEAGTIDEALFVRKCAEKGIDYHAVRPQLFNDSLSRHGRLRWRKEVDSADALLRVLGKTREESADLVDMYENTYAEKEKLWKMFELSQPMREKPCQAGIGEAVKITLASTSVFCIESLLDWLYLAGVLKGDPYRYRINIPGSVSEKNWSQRVPLSLEELKTHPVNKRIKKLIVSARRS